MGFNSVFKGLLYCICKIPECDIHIRDTSSDLEPFRGPIHNCWPLLEYALFKSNYQPYLASHLITICTSKSGFTQQVNKITSANRDYFTLKKDSVCLCWNNFWTGFLLIIQCTMPLHLSIHPSFHPSEFTQDSDGVQCEGSILNLFSE
jgi:hypothetical protein